MASRTEAARSPRDCTPTYRPPRSTARVNPEPVNSAPEMTLTAMPADAARSNVVGIGCTCSGGADSRRSSPHGCGRQRRALMTPVPGSRKQYPTRPCSPERRPVPIAASPAAVVDGKPTCSGWLRSAESTGASAAYSASSSAPRPSIISTHAPAMSPGREIGPSKPFAPIADSTDGTTSARCGTSGSGCGRSTCASLPHRDALTCSQIAAYSRTCSQMAA